MSSRYYHYDGLGSTRLLTDEAGNVTDSYCNTAFGTPVDTGAANPTVNPFRYVGQRGYYLYDDTGNYYVRARTYSPVLARWLSEDPLDFVPGEANLFRYVRNMVLAQSDPSGLACSPAHGPFKTGPTTTHATGCGVAISADLDPAPIGLTLANSIQCTRERPLAWLYSCQCGCWPFDYTTNREYRFVQSEQVKIANRSAIFCTGAGVGIPKASIPAGPGLTIWWYSIAPRDQNIADRDCTTSFPKWGKAAPPPATLPCP
jgi:RHS repeat-associated protein